MAGNGSASLAALLAALAMSATLSGCLGGPRVYHYTDSMTVTITPDRSDVPYSVWLPVLFVNNGTGQNFDPLRVAAPSESLRATSGAAVSAVSYESNDTYWRFLRVDATGPVVLSSTTGFDSPNITETEAYLRWGWTAGRDEDVGRGSNRPRELLVGVEVHALQPFNINLTIERNARSDLCSGPASFEDLISPPTGGVIHWWWIPGETHGVCA